MSSLYNVFPERWRKLDLTLARALGCLLEHSQEPRAKIVMTVMYRYTKLGSVVRGRHMVWLIWDHFKIDHISRKPWRQEQPLAQSSMELAFGVCRPSAAPARHRSTSKRDGQRNTDCNLFTLAQDGPGGGETPASAVGACWDFAHLGSCRTEGCTLATPVCRAVNGGH